MGKYCSDCVYLNLQEKKTDGLYKCKKCKKYTISSNLACEQFEETYQRNSFEKQKIYDLGKHVSEEDTPLSIYVVLFILMVIIYIIGKLNGY